MSWPRGRVSDLGCIISGYAFKSTWFGQGTAKVIRIGDLKNGHIDLDGAALFDDVEHTIKDQFKIKADDILMALSGATVGKIAIADSKAEGAYLNQRVAIIRGNTKSSNAYLKYVFSGNLLDTLLRNAGGAAQPNLSPKELANLEIPIPPLEEQKRIAAILDKADAIRRKRQQAIQLADDFLRAVFLDMFGDIPAMKSKYELKGCRGYVSAASGKSSKAVLSEITTDIPIYGGNGINGYATESLYKEPVIVIGRVGQQCAITNLTTGPSWVTDNAIVLKVKDYKKFNQEFLAHAFMHSPIRDAVTRLDLPFINQQMILDQPIPHPPIDEQIKFAKIRETILSAKEKYSKSCVTQKALFDSLSQKAFAGEL